MTALSNRQRRLQRKTVQAKVAKAHARNVNALVSAEPTGVVAQERIRVGIEAQQALKAQTALEADAAANLSVGRVGPLDLRARIAAEFDVDYARDRSLPGVPFRAGGRDGLVALHKTKTLTDAEAKAGLAFRLAYQAATQGLGSCLGRAGEGGGSRTMAGLARSAAELQRAYLLARLNQMERAVAAVLVDGREMHALRMIAGEGHTVREVAGSSGFARAATTAALVRALEAIASELRIAGQ